MAAKRIALAMVVVAVVGIIAVKMSSRTTATSPAAVAAIPAAAASPASRPAVVLVADAREADSDCGCGKIIRRVRAAKAQGVVVEELSPDNADAGRKYGVTVVPSVVFLGPDGQIVARREGESEETLAAVSADLAKLEGARR
jgi:hypothetical protein